MLMSTVDGLVTAVKAALVQMGINLVLLPQFLQLTLKFTILDLVY